MTEEKLIEMLIKKYCVRGYPGGDFVYPSDFDRAIHEALAAKGRGCSNRYREKCIENDEHFNGGIMYAIFNAEPLEEI